jgi:hypothetical protein
MMLPHPVHVIMNLEQRHADFLAETAREHRARLAKQAGDTPAGRQWADLLATLVVIVVLALLVAATVTTPTAPPAVPPLAAIVPS